jgi:hypothetical protein
MAEIKSLSILNQAPTVHLGKFMALLKSGPQSGEKWLDFFVPTIMGVRVGWAICKYLKMHRN